MNVCLNTQNSEVSVYSCIRWCLTSTPLEDLCSWNNTMVVDLCHSDGVFPKIPGTHFLWYPKTINRSSFYNSVCGMAYKISGTCRTILAKRAFHLVFQGDNILAIATWFWRLAKLSGCKSPFRPKVWLYVFVNGLYQTYCASISRLDGEPLRPSTKERLLLPFDYFYLTACRWYNRL
jgi:hypothetical protein